MKRLKRGMVGLFASVCCMAKMSVTAFADTATEPDAGEYGELTGELYGYRTEVVSVTSVNANPDNAYPFNDLVAVGKQGEILGETGMQKSARGVLKFTFYWRDISSDCHSVHGRMDVQGGSTRPAQEVYTYLILD